MTNTVRRDWIKRQIIKGNIEIRTDMILTDDYAYDNSANCHESKEWNIADIKNFTDHDFKYKSGYAYKNEDGSIKWTMLANHYYTIRLRKTA
ncbi:MAG: hypothetical protein PF693_14480 [Spirochaetia bacterium]|jgi:hypothetical protein|nr:hypothetical protein [Spirochaetia bacterium]